MVSWGIEEDNVFTHNQLLRKNDSPVALHGKNLLECDEFWKVPVTPSPYSALISLHNITIYAQSCYCSSRDHMLASIPLMTNNVQKCSELWESCSKELVLLPAL